MKNVKVGDTVKVIEGYPQRGLDEGDTYTVIEVDGDGWLKVEKEPLWWFHVDRFEKVPARNGVYKSFNDTQYGDISFKRKSNGNVEIGLDGICGWSHLTISDEEFEKLVDLLNEML